MLGLTIFILCSASNCLNHSGMTLKALRHANISVSPSPHLVVNDSVNFQVSIDFPGFYLRPNLQMEITLMVEENDKQQVLTRHIVQSPQVNEKKAFKILIDASALLALNLAKG